MPTHASRPRLGHRNPSFSIEQHVLQLISYALYVIPFLPHQSVYPPFAIQSDLNSYPVLPRARRSSEDRRCRYTRTSPEAEESGRNGGVGTSVVDGEPRLLAARRKDDETQDQGCAPRSESWSTDAPMRMGKLPWGRWRCADAT